MNTLRLPKLNHKFTLKIPIGIVSSVGSKEILKALKKEKLPSLPKDWCWEALVPNTRKDKEKYVGSFAKRLSQFFYKEHLIKVPQNTLSNIGSLANLHTLSKSSIYHFDFVNEFDWQDGDFGDEGSCLWHDSRSTARQYMSQGGMLAVRFYNEVCNNKYWAGYGRAWVYPTKINSKRSFIIFNGYGLSTLDITYVLSYFFGRQPYKKIKLVNNNNTHGKIYVNGSGSGYLIGQSEIINRVKKYDMHIFCGEKTCCKCHRGCVDDEYDQYEGEVYCYECFDKFFRWCDICGQVFAHKDIVFIDAYNYGITQQRSCCKPCRDRLNEAIEKSRKTKKNNKSKTMLASTLLGTTTPYAYFYVKI